MRLSTYLSRTYDTVFSRRGITVEYYDVTGSSLKPTTIVEGRFALLGRFYAAI